MGFTVYGLGFLVLSAPTPAESISTIVDGQVTQRDPGTSLAETLDWNDKFLESPADLAQVTLADLNVGA